MLILIGLIIVVVLILHKRSTEIITVNPLRGQRQAPLPGDEPQAENTPPSFAGVLGAIKQAAEQAAKEASQTQASPQGRAAIIQLVRENRFLEAIELYRRLYGVELSVAKRAIEKMMLDR